MNDTAPPSRPRTLGDARDWLDTLTVADVPTGLRLRPWMTVSDPTRLLDWLRGGLAPRHEDGGPVPASWRSGAVQDAHLLFSVLYPGS